MVSRGQPRVELIFSVATQDNGHPPKKSQQSLDSGVETPLTMKWQLPVSARDVPDAFGMDRRPDPTDVEIWRYAWKKE